MSDNVLNTNSICDPFPIPIFSGVYWLDITKREPQLVREISSLLVSFETHSGDSEYQSAGTGFVMAEYDGLALVVTAKHVFSDGLKKIQEPNSKSAASSPFTPDRQFMPDLTSKKVMLKRYGVIQCQHMTSGYYNYRHDLDVAICIARYQDRELAPTIARSLPLDCFGPQPNELVHIASIKFGLENSNALAGTNLRIGRVSGIYPNGYRQYKWPCFTTTVPMEAGMSGGLAVVRRPGQMAHFCGIVSADNSSADGLNNQSVPGESVFALAWPLLTLKLPLTLPFKHGDPEESLHTAFANGKISPRPFRFEDVETRDQAMRNLNYLHWPPAT